MLKVIGVACRDLDQTEKFYNVLGLTCKRDPQHPHMEAVTATGLQLMFTHVDLMKALDPTFQACDTPLAGPSLGFDFEAPADVDSTAAALKAAGFTIKTEPCDVPWARRFAVAVDPDGTKVELSVPPLKPFDDASNAK